MVFGQNSAVSNMFVSGEMGKFESIMEVDKT